jgi:hypothetical protein
MFALVEEQKRRLLVIDTFKETHASSRLFVTFAGGFKICEGRYPADGFLLIIKNDPPHTFTMPEGFVLLDIEYAFDILIEGPYPMRLVFIKPHGKFQEFFNKFGGIDF